MKKEEGVWQVRASKLFCVVIALVTGWLIFRHALSVVAVIAIAWGTASVIYPLARKTQQKLRLPYKLCAGIYVALILFLLGILLFFLISRLLEELREFLIWAGENREWIASKIEWVFSFAERLSDRIPFIEQIDRVGDGSGLGASVDAMVSDFISQSVSGIGAWTSGQSLT